MNILVCFRAVPDLSMAAEEDWREDPALCVEGALGRVFDAFDESALELGLQIRDQAAALGEDVTLEALTLEPLGEDGRLYEKLFALGYTAVTRLDCEDDLRFAPLAKGAKLAAHIAAGPPPDLLLFGVQGGLSGSRLTGPATAAGLGLPWVPDACALACLGGGRLRVETLAGQTRTLLHTRGPLAVLVGNTASSYLRVPTLKARMAVRGMRARVAQPPAALPGIPEPPPHSVHRPPEKPLCRFVEGAPREQARFILNAFGEVAP